MPIEFLLNGITRRAEPRPDESLLDTLRERGMFLSDAVVEKALALVGER